MIRLLLTLALLPLPCAAQDGRAWFYNRYVSESPLDTVLQVIHGTPQSDDVLAALTCAIGANWIYANVQLNADVSGLAAESTVPLVVSASGYSATMDGYVFRVEEYGEGVEFALPLDDALWTAMMAGGTLTYGVPGRAGETLTLDGAAEPLHALLGDCLSIIDLVPDAATEAAPGK